MEIMRRIKSLAGTLEFWTIVMAGPQKRGWDNLHEVIMSCTEDKPFDNRNKFLGFVDMGLTSLDDMGESAMRLFGNDEWVLVDYQPEPVSSLLSWIRNILHGRRRFFKRFPERAKVCKCVMGPSS